MDDLKMYGVWVPGAGWLKGKDGDQFADIHLDKAQEVARMIGSSARVHYIDRSIVDFEQLYLEQEKRSLWHIFKSLFKRKTSK